MRPVRLDETKEESFQLSTHSPCVHQNYSLRFLASFAIKLPALRCALASYHPGAPAFAVNMFAFYCKLNAPLPALVKLDDTLHLIVSILIR